MRGKGIGSHPQICSTIVRYFFVGKIFRGFRGFEKIIHENKGSYITAKPRKF